MSVVTCHLCRKVWSVPRGQGPEAWEAHYTLHHSDLEAERWQR